MEPLEVVARRGAVVEARHRVHAVAVRGGEVVARAGDAGIVSYLRSASKPIQALPLVRARDDLEDAEIAIASASHLGDDAQVAAARSLLAKAGAGEEQLECGLERGERIRHNCSGKHAGMLALCRAHGWEPAGYRLPDHPVQAACLAAHVELMEEPPLANGIDGCGVVTFAYALERMAHAFARFETAPGGARVAGAMRAHPELIRGPRAADTVLMRGLGGWFAKGGAEGTMCAGGPGGLGVAWKTEDGATRALAPAMHAFLARLGLEPPAELERIELANSRGEPVGEIVSDT